MTTTTTALGDLIETALNALHQESERPLQTTVGAIALTANGDITLTVADHADRITAPMLLEHDQELMLVTGKSADTPPVFTVIRGYAGTPKSNAPTGTELRLEPTWARHKVRNAILTCFRRTLNAKLPNLVTAQMAPFSTKAYVEMPANTVDVNRVTYKDPNSGFPHDLDSWDFDDDMPISTTGKLIRLNPKYVRLNLFTTNLYVTYQTPYTWSAGDDDPPESATIEMPLGSEDLPALYAAAYVLLNREMSRVQMDRTEEWTTEASVRNGISMRLVQQAWSNFYSSLDEARSMQNVPRRIRYRTRRSF